MSQVTLSGKNVENSRPYSPGVFPASHLARPGSEEARAMTVTSGLKCTDWCRSSGPLGLLEKMCLESSTWHSTRCLLNWKIVGTPAGRSLFRLRASMPRTSEIESSLLPTPRGHEAGDYQYSRGDHSKPRLTLSGVAKILPTSDRTRKETERNIAGMGGVSQSPPEEKFLPNSQIRRGDDIPIEKKSHSSCWEIGRSDINDESWRREEIPQPCIRGIPNGVSSRVDRLRALGNAVVPQQVYPFFAAISAIERGEA